jgi:Asp-tRNA(Asn)/Glu-tRNA(Gln) amidotransferase A subunit family amidase
MKLPYLHYLSGVAAQTAIAAKQISCSQLAQACIDRVQARDGVLHAWAHLDSALVLHRAKLLDDAGARGALHGIPIGVKDVIDTFDMPTQMGSPIYRHHQPAADAACVARLRAAGALILGKTDTCEFAGVNPTRTTNPHDAARTPGGSSSGSAAAVADCMVPVALGTQTGGSVLRPASFCGVVGFKPSFGLVNTAGIKPAAASLDTIGLFARQIEDVELVFRVLSNIAAPQWLPPDSRLRIGVCRNYAWHTTQEATRLAIEDTERRLLARGHTVARCELPPAFMELERTRETINDYERAHAMAHEWHLHRELLSAVLTESIRRGLMISAASYVAAQRHVAACRNLLPPLFEQFDVLLAPAVPGEAPMGLHYTGDHRLQSIWTQLQTPAVTLPTHAGEHGLPIGVQLVGAFGGDSALLCAAQLLLYQLGHGPTTHSTSHP